MNDDITLNLLDALAADLLGDDAPTAEPQLAPVDLYAPEPEPEPPTVDEAGDHPSDVSGGPGSAASAALMAQCADFPGGPTAVVDLDKVRQQRRNARADLVVEALHGSRECVATIRDAFASGNADFDDAVKALPTLHRVLEHVEKLEAARNVKPNLPTLNIQFKGQGFVVIPVPPDQSAPPLLESDD